MTGKPRVRAFDRALYETQQAAAIREEQPAVKEQDETLPTPSTPDELPANASTAHTPKLERVSSYVWSYQRRKLDDLAREYEDVTGERIDRQDVIRWLINAGDLKAVQEGARRDEGQRIRRGRAKGS